MAGLGRDVRQQAVIERGRIGAMQDRRRSHRRKPVEHDRHLLHARREDRAGDRREFASAEAAQDLQRVFQMRGMQRESPWSISAALRAIMAASAPEPGPTQSAPLPP